LLATVAAEVWRSLNPSAVLHRESTFLPDDPDYFPHSQLDGFDYHKFTSCPFNEVVKNLFDIDSKNAEENTLVAAATLFANEATSDLQSLHVELCDCMNALGVQFMGKGDLDKARDYFTNVRFPFLSPNLLLTSFFVIEFGFI
jgi:hypothetical protein